MIQQDTLAYALAHLIWKVGNGHSATLCLPHPTTVHVTSSPQFNEDGLTERVTSCPKMFTMQTNANAISLLNIPLLDSTLSDVQIRRIAPDDKT